jgi:death-on-curing protein
VVIRYLTCDEIQTINKYLAIKHGFDFVVLKPGILELCCEAPKRIVFGQEIYPNKIEKAAALMKEITKTHPFLHGNKRTAWNAASTFLELNGYSLKADTDAAVDLSVRTASCTADTPQIFAWMENCCTRSAWQPMI